MEIVQWGGVEFLMWSGLGDLPQELRTRIAIEPDAVLTTGRWPLLLQLMEVQWIPKTVSMAQFVVFGRMGGTMEVAKPRWFEIGQLREYLMWLFGMEMFEEWMEKSMSQERETRLLPLVVGEVLWFLEFTMDRAGVRTLTELIPSEL